MATYVTKRCPNCGNVYQNHKSGDQRRYGSPRLKCVRCGKIFWDFDIVEPALHSRHDAYAIYQAVKRLLTVIILGAMGIVALMSNMGGVSTLVGAVILLTIAAYFAKIIYDFLNQKNIREQRKIEYDESQKRLEDMNYLKELAKHDSKAKKLLESRMKKQN